MPQFDSAEILAKGNGDLIMRFSEDVAILSPSSFPFTLTLNTTYTRTISHVGVVGTTVVLHPSTPITHWDSVEIAYTVPTAYLRSQITVQLWTARAAGRPAFARPPVWAAVARRAPRHANPR